MPPAPGDCDGFSQCVAELGELIAAAAADPGSSGFPALVALIGGLLLTSFALTLHRPRQDVQWAGFLGAFLGGWVGLVVYLIVLIGVK